MAICQPAEVAPECVVKITTTAPTPVSPEAHQEGVSCVNWPAPPRTTTLRQIGDLHFRASVKSTDALFDCAKTTAGRQIFRSGNSDYPNHKIPSLRAVELMTAAVWPSCADGRVGRKKTRFLCVLRSPPPKRTTASDGRGPKILPQMHLFRNL